MDSTYTYACEVVWRLAGEQEAGWELVRALDSTDQEIREMASSALCESGPRLQELIATGLSAKQITEEQAAQCFREMMTCCPVPIISWTN